MKFSAKKIRQNDKSIKNEKRILRTVRKQVKSLSEIEIDELENNLDGIDSKSEIYQISVHDVTKEDWIEKSSNLFENIMKHFKIKNLEYTNYKKQLFIKLNVWFKVTFKNDMINVSPVDKDYTTKFKEVRIRISER